MGVIALYFLIKSNFKCDEYSLFKLVYRTIKSLIKKYDTTKILPFEDNGVF